MGYTVPLIINGREVQTATTFDVQDPSTGNILWQSSTATVKEATEACNAAQAAFPAWASKKAAERRDVLIKAAEIFEKRTAEFSTYMRSETGSLEDWADNGTVPSAWEMIRDVAGRIVTVTSIVPALRDENANAIIYKEPYGVVLAFAPWLINPAHFTHALR